MPTELAAAIVGTRDPSPSQRERAKGLAWELSSVGIDINTGAAVGIDLAAMEGTKEGFLNVFLPWRSFNANLIPKHANITLYDIAIHWEWYLSVNQFHPAADRLKGGAFALHARNYGIVKPVQLVVAFPNETGEGGTGQAIRVANGLGIPLLQYNKGTQIPPLELILRQAVAMIKAKAENSVVDTPV
jgi:hypothetical protein